MLGNPVTMGACYLSEQSVRPEESELSRYGCCPTLALLRGRRLLGVEERLNVFIPQAIDSEFSSTDGR